MFDPAPKLSGLVTDAAGLDLEDVPQEIRDHTARVIADTLGVIMAGARRTEIEAFIQGGGQLFPPLPAGSSQLLVARFPRVDPVTAAFVNATAGTFLELDEGYRPTGHPAIHIVPAALAAAQALHSSGRKFMAAVLSGYEVTARLFEAYRLTYPLHPHGHFGSVGAAVAVARLRHSDPVEPAMIAATLPLLPVWQPCLEGANARNAYTGTAAAIGVTANRMALAGFTGSRQAQPAAFGELVGQLVCPEAITEPVDPTRLRITRNYLKLHSACALTHSALEAVLALGRIRAEDVVRIEVETVANNLKIAQSAQPNNLSTRFSIPYAVATAIIHGHTRPEAFEPKEEVAALAERVHVSTAPDLEVKWPDAAPARVTVQTGDTAYSACIDNPRGHHANPASPDELRAKFEFLTSGVGGEHLYAKLLGLQEMDDVYSLLETPA